MTTYTLAGVESDGRASTLRLTAGADAYLGRVVEVDPQTGVVVGMGLPYTEGAPCAGVDRDWVASNEDQTKFWRADYLGGDRSESRYRFKLKGAPVAESDFGRSRAFRLWEYGVGDTVRQSAFASVRRLAPGAFEITGDADLEVTLPGKPARKLPASELTKSPVVVK